MGIWGCRRYRRFFYGRGVAKIISFWPDQNGESNRFKIKRFVLAFRRGVLARSSGKMKMGLYARVSTHDQQTLPLQRDALTAYAKQRGGSIVRVVEDVGSGARERVRREELGGAKSTRLSYGG
jgi:Resolvase, N terminal domain